MKFGISQMIINFEKDFIEDLDRWKELVIKEGIKSRIKKLIIQDKEKMEKK